MDVLFEHGLPALGLWSVDESPSQGGTFGAVIFWGYIATALYLLYDLTRTIFALKKISKILQYGYSPVYVWTFTLLGVLSFASASWNMMNVLIRSYQAWAQRSGVVAPQRLFGDDSLLGPDRIDLQLWTWSVQSTPFRDFALEITADPARWTWAQASLGFTCVLAFWMGIQGRKGKPIPKLWTFFALLQILPVSVTLNFYILALLFTPQTPPKQFVLKAPAIWIGAGLGYFFLLFEASQREMRPAITSVIIGARLLLLVPFYMSITYVDPKDEALEKVSPLQMFDLPLAFTGLAVWSCIHSGFFAVEELGAETVWNAKSAHPAVSTLAYDAIQTAITLAAWAMSAPYARPEVPQAAKVAEQNGKTAERKKKSGKKQ